MVRAHSGAPLHFPMTPFLNFIHQLYQFDQLIRWGGHLVLIVIIFSETGIMAGFFLPGDSLLVTAGLFAATGYLNLARLLVELSLAAIIGDSVSYAIGHQLGPRIFTKEDSLFFHKAHLMRAHRFYEKYGAKTIVIARFVPIIRTFAPVVAGVGEMKYKRFLTYNIVGGIGWVVSMISVGFFLGRSIPNIDRHVHKIIFIVIFLSILPAIIEIWKERRLKATGPGRHPGGSQGPS
jgi:membrane-associated protein